ncbi:MAG: response regulator [Candidatus Marinimicrobia bacterium]|nr:response regulator [Candidatus Neomarinimicrobiota bacterium]
MKILIVEDDEASRYYISLIVNDVGSEILEAETGTDAIELCRNNKDIDLIFNGYKNAGNGWLRSNPPHKGI